MRLHRGAISSPNGEETSFFRHRHILWDTVADVRGRPYGGALTLADLQQNVSGRFPLMVRELDHLL
jgi:hypothetical protein